MNNWFQSIDYLYTRRETHNCMGVPLFTRMVELVEQMLDLNKQLAGAKAPQTKTVLQRRIETTDRQIDRLVYELYDLTEEEIKIVEGP